MHKTVASTTAPSCYDHPRTRVAFIVRASEDRGSSFASPPTCALMLARAPLLHTVVHRTAPRLPLPSCAQTFASDARPFLLLPSACVAVGALGLDAPCTSEAPPSPTRPNLHPEARARALAPYCRSPHCLHRVFLYHPVHKRTPALSCYIRVGRRPLRVFAVFLLCLVFCLLCLLCLLSLYCEWWVTRGPHDAPHLINAAKTHPVHIRVNAACRPVPRPRRA